ncbi:hypothetical protein ELQ92_03605 [Labedella populi]|uniref:Tox-PL domain-containing protein n=1 Tax=Labedella populi TaxID=2498850 RepID=A0A444QFE0_9MICO|nr:toxin glutamine deamidase domain-containing protein [Labedella populi]RWZ68316.1 hypothetical protein ELQ92_03605 [Labedella populi]
MDSSAFEAAVAADAAAADADSSDAPTSDAPTTDAPTTDASRADTVDPEALDADDAVAAGAVAAGAVGVVGLHTGASGGKAPTVPSTSTAPSTPTSPTAPTSPDAPGSPIASTPNDPSTPTTPGDASAGTPEANTADAQQPGSGNNTTERTTAEIDAALAAINPNFDPFDPANGYATNCGNTSSILNDFLNGDPTREAPTGTLDVPQMEARTGNPQTPMTPEQIADSLRGMGAGSHCVVGIDRSTGDGHWFNAYFDGTTVWSIDAQTGTRSPWPPNEPNATTWDASIRPENVAVPAPRETDAASGAGDAPSADDSRKTQRSGTTEPLATTDPAVDRSVGQAVGAGTASPVDPSAYASGDSRFPGTHPPVTPTAGTSGGGSGEWHTTPNRHQFGDWPEYQEQISGSLRDQNGTIVEYRIWSEGHERFVEFDGHTLRGDPPVEVFLESKHGYAHVADQDSFLARIDSPKFVTELRAQLDALPDGARLEWHFSDFDVAAAVREYFSDRRIRGVDVVFTPKA